MYFKRTVLDNGITVLTESMDSVRSISLGVWFKVGSRDEQEGEYGFSHLLEHMMFKRTPSRDAKQISQEFDQLGADLNAFTSKEQTCYYARFVDKHLEKVLEILSDMVTHPLFTQEDLNVEREVILEEMSRSHDDPSSYVFDIFQETLWPQNDLGREIIGDYETIAHATHEQCVDFHTKHYTTQNMVIAAAGSVDHQNLVQLVSKYFEEFPSGSIQQRPTPKKTNEGGVVKAHKQSDSEQVHLCIGLPALNSHDPKRFAFNILDTVLGGGMSSRLFQEIREKRGLVYHVGTYQMTYPDIGGFVCYAGTRPENVEEVISLVKQNFHEVAQNGITQDELERSQNLLAGQLVLAMESTRVRMNRLGRGELREDELLSIEDLVKRYKSITLEEVQSVAEEILCAQLTCALIGPNEVHETEKLVSQII